MTFVCPWRHVALILSGRQTMIKTAEVRNISSGRRWNEKCWTGFLRNWQFLSYSKNSPPLRNPKIRYGFYNRPFLVPSWAISIQSVRFRSISVIFLLILTHHLRSVLSSVLFHWLFWQKFGMSFLRVLCVHLTFQIRHPWFDYPTNVQRTVQNLELLTMQFLPSSLCHCLLFRSKYPPRRFVLKHLRTISSYFT